MRVVIFQKDNINIWRERMKDKMIICVQCENPFVITAAEQGRLYERGFGIPKRCPDCRQKKSKPSSASNNRMKNKRLKKRRDLERRYGDYDL